MTKQKEAILVVNAGSSSLKLGLYCTQEGEELSVLEGLADGVGGDHCKLSLRDAAGKVLREETFQNSTQEKVLGAFTGWMAEFGEPKLVAVGHRVVHGGPRLLAHQLITPAVLQDLKDSVHFAPLHIPVALELIAGTERVWPALPQFACFDTVFHRTLPEVASRFALPDDLFEQGVRRYGFHGLSYESIVHQLGSALPERTVIAHLGNGASLAAVREGCSVDTSMGLTPTGGIPMGTRSGDLDPGVLLYLMRTRKADADALEKMLNHEAGLKALSAGESDMRALEAAAEAGDAKAQLAIEIFCRAIAKTVAAYAAVLGGLDLLVFTGGIGEHSARVRAAVCQQLAFLGVVADQGKNAAHAAVINTPDSKVAVKAMTTEEDAQIARHCRELMARPA